MKKLIFVLLFVLLAQSVLAQNETTAHGFSVGDVVKGTTSAYVDKTGVVTNIEFDKVYVRWEGLTNAVAVDPDKITQSSGDPPPESFTPQRGQIVTLETNYVKELFNDIKTYYETGTCDDGVKNQGETGIDCGGPCPLCETTPTPDVQGSDSFLRTRYDITLDEPKKAVFGTARAEAIPAPQLASSDVTRIAQAVTDSRWTREVKAQVGDVQESVSDLKSKQKSLESSADSIKSRVETVNTNINSINDKVANLQNPLSTVQSQVSRLSGQTETSSNLSIASLSIGGLLFLLICYLLYSTYALKKELHQVTQTSPEDLKKLKEYFKRMMEKGYEPAVIKQELINEGFSRASVDIAHKQIKVE
ncbi:MAG: hypothetical protein ACE5FT_00605 [Candidatus Nanoarchaeia archaeon]